tara:strand:+ start:53 stop:586 length:534 start_codon:yes stop_codon:yes gene_type:complete
MNWRNILKRNKDEKYPYTKDAESYFRGRGSLFGGFRRPSKFEQTQIDRETKQRKREERLRQNASSFFTEEQIRQINRGRKEREKEELRFKRQNRNPRDSKKVRDAEMQELEEEFGNVTDSPSFGQPQPKTNQQRKRKKVGFGMAGNKTNPMPRRAKRKARNRPYNPFTGEGRQVGKK